MTLRECIRKAGGPCWVRKATWKRYKARLFASGELQEDGKARVYFVDPQTRKIKGVRRLKAGDDFDLVEGEPQENFTVYYRDMVEVLEHGMRDLFFDPQELAA